MFRRSLAATWILLVFAPVKALACTCITPTPAPCSESRASIIFVGTVIEVDSTPTEDPRTRDYIGLTRHRFRVDEGLVGLDAAEVDVYSADGTCGYRFRQGEQYLVFPYQAGDGRLYAGICSKTRPITYAGHLLPQLRAERDGRQVASVFGILWRRQRYYGAVEEKDFDQPLSNTVVQLRSDKFFLEARTDQDGVYTFYTVPAGAYSFWAYLPDHLELSQRKIELPAGACFEQNLAALPTGRIRGRVLDPKGQPLRSANVELFRADRYDDSATGPWELQGKKGYFEFNHVVPGNYILVFNQDNNPDPDAPFPRTFYPGVRELRSAEQIRLREGEERLNADIHVSEGRPTRQLVVRLRWESGEQSYYPLGVVAEGTEGDHPSPREVESGVYQLNLLRNARYTIYAWQVCRLQPDDPPGVDSLETQRVVVDGADDRPSEITLFFSRGCGEPEGESR